MPIGSTPSWASRTPSSALLAEAKARLARATTKRERAEAIEEVDRCRSTATSGENITVGARVTNGQAKYDHVLRRNVWGWTARVIALHDGHAWVKQTTGSFVGTLWTFKVDDLFNVEGIDPA